jgi:membrane protease YdiL (CAAX protease family)
MTYAVALKSPVSTYCGLAIALFASPAITIIYRLLTGENSSDGQVVARELYSFAAVGLLMLVITRWESLPLTSIGLRFDAIGKSLLRGLCFTVIILAATIGLFFALKALGIHLGEDRAGAFHPSPLVVTLSMLRAGVAEEIFYRGYAIERLQSLTGNKLVAALVPLVLFAAAHYRQGIGGIIAVFVLGAIFTALYLKFRDLLANITAHFLADFTLNVTLPAVSGG